jgi:hypothetical protein
MPDYIFRFPADTPPLTYDGLKSRRRIGTTVTIHHFPGSAVLELYDTPLAVIYLDRVEFTKHGDRHMTTTEWLYRIVTDNGLGSAVFTDHFVRYVINPAGGGDRAPLEGNVFPVAAEIREAGAR